MLITLYSKLIVILYIIVSHILVSWCGYPSLRHADAMHSLLSLKWVVDGGSGIDFLLWGCPFNLGVVGLNQY